MTQTTQRCFYSLVICLLIAMLSETTESLLQNGVYNLSGPSGINVSFNATYGVLVVNRILNRPQVYQTTDAVTTMADNLTTNSFGSPDEPFQRTNFIVLRLRLMQQWNTTSDEKTPQQLLKLDKCSNITDDRPFCDSFSCPLNDSVQEIVKLGICRGTGVVQVEMKVEKWKWCHLGDQSLCGSASLEMMFEFSISQDLSISKAEGPGVRPNFTAFNLGYKEALAQFANMYNENNGDLSISNSTLPSLTLTNTHEAKVNISFNHIVQSPVTNLAYELVIDPGNITAREKVISGGEKMETSIVLLFFSLFSALRFLANALNVSLF